MNAYTIVWIHFMFFIQTLLLIVSHTKNLNSKSKYPVLHVHRKPSKYHPQIRLKSMLITIHSTPPTISLPMLYKFITVVLSPMPPLPLLSAPNACRILLQKYGNPHSCWAQSKTSASSEYVRKHFAVYIHINNNAFFKHPIHRTYTPPFIIFVISSEILSFS